MDAPSGSPTIVALDPATTPKRTVERDLMMAAVLGLCVLGIVGISVAAILVFKDWQIPNAGQGFLKDIALVLVGGYFGAKMQQATTTPPSPPA